MRLEDKNATADRILFLEWMYVNYLCFTSKEENTANLPPHCSKRVSIRRVNNDLFSKKYHLIYKSVIMTDNDQ